MTVGTILLGVVGLRNGFDELTVFILIWKFDCDYTMERFGFIY